MIESPAGCALRACFVRVAFVSCGLALSGLLSCRGASVPCGVPASVELILSSRGHRIHRSNLHKPYKFVRYKKDRRALKRAYHKNHIDFSLVGVGFSLVEAEFSLVEAEFSLVEAEFSLAEAEFSLVEAEFSLVKGKR